MEKTAIYSFFELPSFTFGLALGSVVCFPMEAFGCGTNEIPFFFHCN